MKISPVQGIPTIPNPSLTGLSPEKLAAIKAIANNQPPPVVEPGVEKHEDAIELGQVPTSTTQRIKMNTNRSTTLPINDAAETHAAAAPLKEEEPKVAEATPVIPDNVVQAKPEPEAIGTVSPELAELARQKRALQVKERELLDKEKALKAQPADGYVKLDDLKANALSVLQKAGVTYDQLTNEILGQQSAQPDLKAFKEDLLKTIDEKLAGNDKAQEDNVYNYMRQEVDKLSNLIPYRFIKEEKAQDKVMELVKRMWKEQGEILTETEAMDLIEAELRADARRYAKYLRELEPTKSPEEPPPVQVTGQKTKTLTNKDSARPLVSRRQRAIAAALGQKH